MRPGMRLAWWLSIGLIRLLAPVVPREQRREWREEWESELWHEAQPGVPATGRRSRGVHLLARAAGTPRHALSLRVAGWSAASIAEDVRWALRSVRRQPGHTLLTALLLGLGIGGTTALFSTVNAVLLRGLPFVEPDRLLWAYGVFSGGDHASVSPPDFLDYRASSRVFTEIAAMRSYPTSITLDAAEPEEVASVGVTSNFFRTLGVQPMGRGFTQAEEAAATSDVVMISESLWRRRYGGESRLPGGTIQVDGRAQTVVGIVPDGQGFPGGVEIWLPLTFGDADFSMRGAHFLRPIVRLAAGVTPGRAQAEVDAIAARLAAAYPRSNTSWRLRLIPLRTALSGDVRAPLLVLLGAVGLVLLIACANVSGLMLARASVRQGEMAVRAALGASRSRVFRQLLAEAVLVALLAGTGGLIAAHWLQAGFARWSSLTPPGLVVKLDSTVLLFALGISIATGILSGLVPAWRLADGRLSTVIREGRDPDAGGAGARSALIVVEVALAVVLVSSALLLLRSFTRLRAQDPGFRTAGAVVSGVRFPEGRYADGAAVIRALDAMLERLRAVPGVTGAGAINALPVVEQSGDTRLYPAQRPPADPNEWRTAQVRYITEGYFDAMQIPLLSGRTSTEADGPASRQVVVINAALRDRFFADEQAVGQTLMIGVGEASPFEVIGVVGSVRQVGLGTPPLPEFYIPIRQIPFTGSGMTIVVRTRLDPTQSLAAVREAVRAVDPGQALPMLAPLEEVIASTVAEPRFRAALLSAFAGFALILATLGLYALLAFIVNRRTREIGIRMALGASVARVTAAVIRRGVVMAGAGLLVGMVASLGVARLLRSALHDIGPADPGNLILTATLIAGIAFLACLLPAARAARIDPAIALRKP
jgi:putative ABC transport system permease protein